MLLHTEHISPKNTAWISAWAMWLIRFPGIGYATLPVLDDGL